MSELIYLYIPILKQWASVLKIPRMNLSVQTDVTYITINRQIQNIWYLRPIKALSLRLFGFPAKLRTKTAILCHCVPFEELKGLLTDIGTEELGHLEMVGAIVHQLTRNLKDSQIQDSAFAPYFVDHTAGVYPTAASGFPWSAASIAVKGDPIADLTEDLAAEQKARVTYDNILRLSDDPDVNNVIKFLREREVVHFQRFGEAMQLLREKLNQKNVYYMNPAFDM